MTLFDRVFSVPSEELDFKFRCATEVPWADFLLNPRRLRGSDFLMRWSQGVWSERRVIEAINSTDEFHAIPYGPSGTAPSDDPRAVELYFERLDAAGHGDLKRPDVLVFTASGSQAVAETVEQAGGVKELPFHTEDSRPIRELLGRAIMAIECENSLWRAKEMPNYGEELRPMRRLDNRNGLPKSAVLPTIMIKEEDREGVRSWQAEHEIPLHIWQVFYDVAYGISLDRAEELIDTGLISPTVQTYQAPGGQTTRKDLYKIYYHYAYEVGDAVEEAELKAGCIVADNGHVLPYVRFEGGSLELAPAAMEVLRRCSGKGA